MLKFAFKRLLEAIPVLFITATVTFFMIRLAPGGPFDTEKAMPKQVQQALNTHYGLDAPIWIQYTRYIKGLINGDLGPSFKYPGWTVTELIKSKILISFELGFYALLIALFIGVVAGIIASLKPNTWWDYLSIGGSMVGICLPTFVLGPTLLLLFALHLEWVNVSGWHLPGDRILPAITLGIFYAGYIARLTRGSMLEVINQDYIRTARSKGLPEWKVITYHALRNGILPIIAFLGPATAGLISGSFVVETIFNIPGLGSFFVKSAFNRDYTMVLGTVLFYATLLIVLNLVADIVQAWLNPKQKWE